MRYVVELEIDVDEDHPLLASDGNGAETVIEALQDWVYDDDYMTILSAEARLIR